MNLFRLPHKKIQFSDFLTKLGLFSINRYKRGYPEGFPREEFKDLMKLRWGGGPTRTYFRHLSGWKRSGTFRLVFIAEGGGQGSLIFKNSIYTKESIAALEGLPIVPGPPEYAIHAGGSKKITPYLPETYWCQEVQTGKHYQYLLEDVSPNYVYDSRDNTILSICNQLPSIQEKLSNSMDSHLESVFLNFDQDFSARLFLYAVDNLKKLHKVRKVENLREFLDGSDRISSTYFSLMKEVYIAEGIGPIHGDLNPSNVFRHRSANAKFKLIDWEWAGIGLRHSDLASLLKTATPEIEKLGLIAYDKAARARNLTGSRRTYLWCKFQRGLFDAAFFAKQALNESVRTRINLEYKIDRALNRTLASHKALLET